MKEYMDIEELAEYLGMKKSTLYAKVASKQIPHYKIDRLVRFKKSEIDHWMDSFKHDRMNIEENAEVILKTLRKENTDVETLIKKSIETVRDKRYNPSCGKPGQGLGKETDDERTF
jgi:excisionase family DNA binding protein